MLASLASEHESMLSVLPELIPEFKAPRQIDEFPFITGLTRISHSIFIFVMPKEKCHIWGLKVSIWEA